MTASQFSSVCGLTHVRQQQQPHLSLKTLTFDLQSVITLSTYIKNRPRMFRSHMSLFRPCSCVILSISSLKLCPYLTIPLFRWQRRALPPHPKTSAAAAWPHRPPRLLHHPHLLLLVVAAAAALAQPRIPQCRVRCRTCNYSRFVGNHKWLWMFPNNNNSNIH